jgi:hypothetical protein
VFISSIRAPSFAYLAPQCLQAGLHVAARLGGV